MDKVIQRSAASAEESASASEEMTAQAGQMKVYVEELVTVIGGSQAGDNNLLSSPIEGKQQETVTKIVALPFLASRRHEKIKGRQRKTVTPAKAVSSRSEQLIPFEAEEFRSF
jgi:methyl-accepting chemotaxis protein